MNVFKRIAEIAHNRFLNVERGVSTSEESDELALFDRVTPVANMNVIRVVPNAAFAPQRRTTGAMRYIPRREQIVNNGSLPTDPTDVAEGIASTSTATELSSRPQVQQRGPHQRHSFQIQIARNLIDFARGYPNTRAHHRRVIQNKASNASRMISTANPQYFPNSFVDELVVPYKLSHIFNSPLPSREEMERHAWNPDDRSLNIYVKDQDKLTIHRHPVPQSTDSIRGKMGYSKGFHVWQLIWEPQQRGTHPVVGVATKNSILHAAGYGSLLGLNSESYGWDIKANKCFHESKTSKGWAYPQGKSCDFTVSEKFYCILDMDEGYLAFATSNEYLGIAFRGLKGKTLYPVICAVWGHCEITMRYMGGLKPEPRLLLDVCCRKVRLQMGKSRLDCVKKLELPGRLEHLVLGKGM